MMKLLKGTLIFTLFLCAILFRVQFITQEGKDLDTYKRAVVETMSGKNLYEWTVRSYTYGKDPWNHGYAYLPALLYVYLPLYILAVLNGLSYVVLWKIPIILADLVIGYLLFTFLSRKNYYFGLLAAFAWLFNPYLLVTHNYTYSDPLAVMFMLLALLNLEENDGLAGVFYGLSIAFKTFPVLLFPIFLFKSKKPVRFLFFGLLVGLIISIPFLKDMATFQNYINGALLIHGERAMQGRPFLWYLSYITGIELLRVLPLEVYSGLATFSGWIVSAIALFSKKLKEKVIADKYVLSLISFFLFYLFTHVLNRTYLLWFMPVLFMALHKLFEEKLLYYAVSVLAFYGFYAWYLVMWVDGFHITPLA